MRTCTQLLVSPLLVVIAALLWWWQAPASATAAAGTAAAGTLPSTQGGPSPHPARTGAPVRLHLPADGIDAPVVPVTVDADGALGVPGEVATVGWWSGGAEPGSSVGTVVLDGHVDSATAGPGALFRLASTPLDAIIRLDTTVGTVEYRVVARREYAKQALPNDLFSQDGPPRLVLVTCGGRFDAATGHYRDNVVVYAVPGG